jgi:hypothetical protein
MRIATIHPKTSHCSNIDQWKCSRQIPTLTTLPARGLCQLTHFRLNLRDRLPCASHCTTIFVTQWKKPVARILFRDHQKGTTVPAFTVHRLDFQNRIGSRSSLFLDSNRQCPRSRQARLRRKLSFDFSRRTFSKEPYNLNKIVRVSKPKA